MDGLSHLRKLLNIGETMQSLSGKYPGCRVKGGEPDNEGQTFAEFSGRLEVGSECRGYQFAPRHAADTSSCRSGFLFPP